MMDRWLMTKFTKYSNQAHVTEALPNLVGSIRKTSLPLIKAYVISGRSL